MDTKETDNIFEIPRKFLQQVQPEIQQLSQQQVSTPKSLLKQKQDRLARYEKQLKATIEAKEAASRRYDKQIDQIRKTIKGLQDEIKVSRDIINLDHV